jgi:hypothetical protein
VEQTFPISLSVLVGFAKISALGLTGVCSKSDLLHQSMENVQRLIR